MARIPPSSATSASSAVPASQFSSRSLVPQTFLPAAMLIHQPPALNGDPETPPHFALVGQPVAVGGVCSLVTPVRVSKSGTCVWRVLRGDHVPKRISLLTIQLG